jgi:hypothetical protein
LQVGDTGPVESARRSNSRVLGSPFSGLSGHLHNMYSFYFLYILSGFLPLDELSCCAGIFKQSMGARNRVGIRLSCRHARLHSLVELVPWDRFLGSLKV